MCVHDDPLGFAECHAEHDIRRLAGDTGKFEEFLHCLRNLALVLLADQETGSLNTSGLVPEESC